MDAALSIASEKKDNEILFSSHQKVHTTRETYSKAYTTAAPIGS